MRAIMFAAVAAVALGGCATVSDAISDQTGTTLEQRCERYRVTLPLLHATLTSMSPASPAFDVVAASVTEIQAFLELHCLLHVPPAELETLRTLPVPAAVDSAAGA